MFAYSSPTLPVAKDVCTSVSSVNMSLNSWFCGACEVASFSMAILFQLMGLPCVCFCQDAKPEQAAAAEIGGTGKEEAGAVLTDLPSHAAIVIAASAVRMIPAVARMNVPFLMLIVQFDA